VVGPAAIAKSTATRCCGRISSMAAKCSPSNPREAGRGGVACYPNLASLPEPVHGVSIITPPSVTSEILAQAAEAGIRYVWMQPGAEPADWRERAEQLGLTPSAAGRAPW